ncbi:MAG: dephospho-CoA kinase [Chlamydiae bacterium]|jgi:dephospho-CoA kinase|nr:dephospho-CoA kinase [Chlamydiota bacterium]
MLILKKVAITGGLACGKSSVCQILKNHGVACVVNADEIVHQLLSTKTDLGHKIARLLGSDVIVNGQFDRKKIAEKVFSDPKKLLDFEKLLHPSTLEEINKRYMQASKSESVPLFVVEIPLLYEIQAEDYYDSVITVVSDENIASQRFMKNTSYGKEEYERRMSRQLPISIKAKRADYIVENNGDLENLKNSVIKLIPSLVSI